MARVKYFLAVGALLLALISVSAAAQNDVVWSGCFSAEEREQAPQDGTRLVFFVTNGVYLSDIAVTVTDSAGELVVETTTTGPWLILNLPTGAN